MSSVFSSIYSYISSVPNKYILEYKHSKIKLKIGYLTRIINSDFGNNNNIGSFVFLKNTSLKDEVSICEHSYILNSQLGNNVKTYEKVKLTNVSVGDFTYITSDTHISNAKIGKFCSIGSSCRIGLGKHPTNKFVSSHPIFYSTAEQSGRTFSDKNYFNEFAEVTIGHDVWIGANAVVLDGLKIGDGAIIGAGSVVTKNVPDFSIVGGVPAKLIRYRFLNKEIKFLKIFKWWNKDEEWLKKNYKLFHNIQIFVKKSGSE